MLYLPEDASAAAVLAEAAGFEGWQQRVRLRPGLVTPGLWSSWDIADVLFYEFPEAFWSGKRVLDIGANTGGLSLELLRRGAIVTAVEPSPSNRQKIEWWKAKLKVPEDLLKVVDAGLFDCQTLGAFDVVLCLGLVYHFRHPQLVLDYVGNISARHYVFSTQTYKSDEHVMVNRKDTNPKEVPGNRLAGWHPSRVLFLKMLHVAGFKNIRQIEHPAVLHDWGEKPQTTTNSGYFAADAGTPVDIEKETKRFI